MTYTPPIKECANDEFAAFREKLSQGKYFDNDEIVQLQQRFKEGSIEARNLVVESMIKLVYKRVKKYTPMEMIEDLAQEGVFGVMKALDDYDPSKGAKFTTYASWKIRHAVMSYLRDNGHIRIPAHLIEADRKVDTYTQAYLAQHGEIPSIENVAKETDIPAGKVKEVRKLYICRPSSLNDSLPGYGTDSINSVADKNMIADKGVAVINLENLLGSLNDSQREVVKMKHGFYDEPEMTFEDIAAKVSSERSKGKVSRQRVQQVHARAIDKLRRRIVAMQA